MKKQFAVIAAVGSCAGVAGAGPVVDFSTASISGEVRASASFGSQSETSGGPFAGFFGGLNVYFGADVSPGFFDFASASASQDTSFTSKRVKVSGSVGSDADSKSGELGTASGVSSLDVVFDVLGPATWSFPYGTIGGVHAGGFVSLTGPGGDVFNYSGTFDGESGVIGPGTYTLSAEVTSFTATNDGFGGLFGGASMYFKFKVIPSGGTVTLLGAAGMGLLRRRRRAG